VERDQHQRVPKVFLAATPYLAPLLQPVVVVVVVNLLSQVQRVVLVEVEQLTGQVDRELQTRVLQVARGLT
jgi:hypothetical protein